MGGAWVYEPEHTISLVPDAVEEGDGHEVGHNCYHVANFYRGFDVTLRDV